MKHNPSLTYDALRPFFVPKKHLILCVSPALKPIGLELRKGMFDIWDVWMNMDLAIATMPDKYGWKIGDYYSKGDNTN